MRAASTRTGARRLLPTATSCGCRWVWFQRLVSGAYSPLGCPRHSPVGSELRELSQMFHVKPEDEHVESCTPWTDGTYCLRNGGWFTEHRCAEPDGSTAKRCRCACGAVE